MEQIWLGDWETVAPPNHSPDPLRTPTDHTYLEWQEVMAVTHIAFTLHRVIRINHILLRRLDSLKSSQPGIFSRVGEAIVELKSRAVKILERRQHISRRTGEVYQLEHLARIMRESPEAGPFVAGMDDLIREIGLVASTAGDILSAVQRARDAVGILCAIQGARVELPSCDEDALPSEPDGVVYSVHPGLVSVMLEGLDMVEAAVEGFIGKIKRQDEVLKVVRGLRYEPPLTTSSPQLLLPAWNLENWMNASCEEVEGVIATYTE